MGTRVKRSCAGLLLCLPLVAVADEPPDIALLDFMAQWQDADGTLLDPAMFDEPPTDSPDHADGADDVEP